MQGLSQDVRADLELDRHSQLLGLIQSIWAMRTSTAPRARPASRALVLGAGPGVGTGPRAALAWVRGQHALPILLTVLSCLAELGPSCKTEHMCIALPCLYMPPVYS